MTPRNLKNSTSSMYLLLIISLGIWKGSKFALHEKSWILIYLHSESLFTASQSLTLASSEYILSDIYWKLGVLHSQLQFVLSKFVSSAYIIAVKLLAVDR